MWPCKPRPWGTFSGSQAYSKVYRFADRYCDCLFLGLHKILRCCNLKKVDTNGCMAYLLFPENRVKYSSGYIGSTREQRIWGSGILVRIQGQ